MIIGIPYFHVLTGKGTNGKEIIPTGTIEALVNRKPELVTATGNGPVNALFNAVDRLSPFNGYRYSLIGLEIHPSSVGSDAAGEARVLIKGLKKTYDGTAISTDILEALLLAYVAALNRMINSEA